MRFTIDVFQQIWRRRKQEGQWSIGKNSRYIDRNLHYKTDVSKFIQSSEKCKD